jgi:ribosomal protein S18 acetylase RimI-like enzyme
MGLFTTGLAIFIDMPTKNIIIRPARGQDLPTLLSFEQSLITAERPFDPTFKTGTFHYYDLAAFIDDPDTQLLVAEVNQQIIASGYVTIREGKHYNAFTHHGFMGFMYTVPEYRGQGINQLIIQELTKWAVERNITELRLQVYDENEPAIMAYEKAGFKKLLVEMRADVDDIRKSL